MEGEASKGRLVMAAALLLLLLDPRVLQMLCLAQSFVFLIPFRVWIGVLSLFVSRYELSPLRIQGDRGMYSFLIKKEFRVAEKGGCMVFSPFSRRVLVELHRCKFR